MTTKILGVCGARPNFMKIDPVFRALERKPESFSTYLVHTGQHYDERMASIFFRDLGLRAPDVDLEVGSGSHAQQTGAVMIEIEKILLDRKPDIVIVVGDVNSTLAAAVSAVKLHIPVAHVEAGLRSFDRQMPEEINRVVTDAVSSVLFTTCRDADDNLSREGIASDRIHFVGNVMIDTLQRCLPRARQSDICSRLGLTGAFGLLTLHRPSNVDDVRVFEGILAAVEALQRHLPIVFPIHPRTEKQLRVLGLGDDLDRMSDLIKVPPLGYLDFLALQSAAKLVLTDSGGVQEETTVLGVPCLTLRTTTERPVTVSQGTNRVTGPDKDEILAAASAALQGKAPVSRVPDLWDGRAAERIVEVLEKYS